MQKLLHDYGICQEYLTIYYDNTSAINISKNPVQHSRTKHIEIRHHFIRELVEDGTLTLEFIHTDDQKTNLFTKPLNSKCFEFLRQNIGVISMDWYHSLLFLSHAFAYSFYTLLCLTFFCLFFFFSFALFCFSYKKNLKNQKNTKTVCVLCTLELVYLGWPLQQSFLNFVSLVV